MVSFTDRERREFVRNGFLVRDDLLSEDLLASAYGAVVDAIDADPDDPADVIGAGYAANTDGVDQAPFADIAAEVHRAADALVGDGALAPPGDGMQIALNFPDEDATATVPDPDRVGGHLDGYANFDENPEVSPFTIGAAVYIDDVLPRGGGFTVWPGSHRIAGAYFEDHALETVGGKPNNSQLPAVGDDPGECNYDARLREQYDPYEIAGDAGTVILWHSFLTHTAGTNAGEDIRMAAIARFGHAGDWDGREAARDPFGDWPAMADVPLVEGGNPVTDPDRD